MKWLMLLLATAFAQTCINPPRSLSGSWRGTTTGSNLGFTGSCNGVSYNSATGENLVVVSLPMNAPLGGTLTFDTCTGTTWDTELIVSTPLPPGTRCPTNSSMFTCAVANDDSQGCGSGTQSRVSFPGTPGASYAVIVTGFGTSSGEYTLTWNYTMGSLATMTSAFSRSNTPSMRPSSSGSFTSQPSWSSTMSPTPGPSWSSSTTALPSPIPTMSPAGSSSSTITSSTSSTCTQSPSLSFSSSQTITASSSSSPDPSFSNSFTMRASESMSPSVDETPSMSESYTGTSSASQSWSPSKSPAVVVGGSRVSTDLNALGYGSMGIVLGVVLTSIIGVVLYNTNKRNKVRRSVHLSPQIFFNNTPITESSTETKNASFRTLPVQKRVEFDPVPTS